MQNGGGRQEAEAVVEAVTLALALALTLEQVVVCGMWTATATAVAVAMHVHTGQLDGRIPGKGSGQSQMKSHGMLGTSAEQQMLSLKQYRSIEWMDQPSTKPRAQKVRARRVSHGP
jgi:hypothetical protein